ncbi:cation:proton antiporter [Fodinicola feengrottensis]|uniref:Cation:proton antiporter n=1 Tax=Fodinicola feengrottensis TaxID=435914 RepID=A0ABN2FZM6_9ACTN
MQLLLVVVGAIAVTAVANRKGLQPSLVVVMLAAAISFVPGLPRFELPPALILGVVLPPLLYSAALDFSFVSFMRNLRPILSLGVALVIVSTFLTGVVAWWIVPGLTLAPALVLGSVVAPTDAVAALSVGRQLGLPKKVMAILTGESLVNDAAALTFFSLAVAAATGEHTVVESPQLLFLYEVVGGVLIGMVLGGVVHWIRQRLRDSGLETAFSLVVPFAAYLLAEQLHASGVIAVVMAGFFLGHNEADAGFGTRLQGRQVWKSMDVLLESFVFAYMGLQCRFVFADLAATGVEWGAFVAIAATLLFVVLAVRPLWIFLTYGNDRLFHRWRLRLANRPAVARRLAARAARQRAAGRPERTPEEPLSWKYAAVLSWSGMRGVVTLAAAAGVPALAGGLSFPQRDLIQALAFVIALGTLLIQTPTLPLLIRRLHISAPEEQRREAEGIRRAHEISREATHQAARKVLESPPEGADPGVLAQYADKLAAAAAERRKADDEDDAVDSAVMSDSARATIRVVRQELLAAQRRALVRARDNWELDDDVVRRQLERLDLEEAAADSGSR